MPVMVTQTFLLIYKNPLWQSALVVHKNLK